MKFLKFCLTCCFVFIFTFVFSINIVNASDMSSKLNVSNSLGSAIDFKITYDANNDVTNVHTILYVSNSSLSTILAQKPGVGGYLGVFYVGVTPQNFIGMPEHKQVNYYYAKGTDFKTVVKPDLNTKIATKKIDTSKDPSTWVYAVAVEYKKDGKWNPVTEAGNGTTSIGENLRKLLNLKSIDDLVYGENYRLFMYENLDWYIQYQEVGNEDNTEYVKISYEIKFPVAAKLEDGTTVSYPSIELALKSESKDIVVNKDVELSENTTIPSDVKLTVQKDVTVNVADNVKVTNKGSIVNNGNIKLNDESEIVNEGNVENDGNIADKNAKYFTIKKDNLTNVTSTLVKEGENVKLNTTDKAGFAKKVKVINTTTNEEVEVKNDSFIMPESNVEISVEYTAIQYKYTSGNNATYNNKDLVFKIDGPLELFNKLYVNDEILNSKYYTLENGSTIITLTDAYLSTLADGTYNLKAEYKNGTNVETTFTINNEQSEDKDVSVSTKEENNPKTGDYIIIYAITFVLALVGITTICIINKKRIVKRK